VSEESVSDDCVVRVFQPEEDRLARNNRLHRAGGLRRPEVDFVDAPEFRMRGQEIEPRLVGERDEGLECQGEFLAPRISMASGSFPDFEVRSSEPEKESGGLSNSAMLTPVPCHTMSLDAATSVARRQEGKPLRPAFSNSQIAGSWG